MTGAIHSLEPSRGVAACSSKGSLQILGACTFCMMRVWGQLWGVPVRSELEPDILASFGSHSVTLAPSSMLSSSLYKLQALGYLCLAAIQNHNQ